MPQVFLSLGSVGIVELAIDCHDNATGTGWWAVGKEDPEVAGAKAGGRFTRNAKVDFDTLRAQHSENRFPPVPQ